jgi:hypothetical protein
MDLWCILLIQVPHTTSLIHYVCMKNDSCIHLIQVAHTTHCNVLKSWFRCLQRASTGWFFPFSILTCLSRYSFLQGCDYYVRGTREREREGKLAGTNPNVTPNYLSGRWSWGRLYGVQTGSPTKRRIACKNTHACDDMNLTSSDNLYPCQTIPSRVW